MRIRKKLKWFLLIDLTLLLAFGLSFWLWPAIWFPVADGVLSAKELLSGVENRSVLVAGHRVHYLAEGPKDGAVVVLVHGLGGHAEDWRKLAQPLSKAGYRVYMPDLLGYGRSDKPEDFSYSVHDEADLVVGFMDALDLKQVDLGGWSMGGWIAQEIAAKQPARIHRLVLIDSGGLMEKPEWDTRLFTPTTPAELNEFLALLMPHPPKFPDVAARIILHIRQGNDWVIRRAVASMLAGRETTDTLLPQLKMPVLIVWDDADRIFPLSQAERMHSLVPQSQLDIVTGCGHMAPVFCSAQIAPKMVEYLQR